MFKLRFKKKSQSNLITTERIKFYKLPEVRKLPLSKMTLVSVLSIYSKMQDCFVTKLR